MAIINPFQRSQTGGVDPSPVSCAITSPAAGASLTEGNVVSITGTISGPGSVVVKKGGTTLGAATVVGLAWSYSYTLVSGDVGSLTFNATATSVFGPAADAPGVTVTVASLFSGNFGTLFAGYGLTVRAYFRGDLGVTGTTGSGKSAWANQLGDFGNMAPASSATNGIGSVGTGLNSKASIITNGTDTQRGTYTAPSAPVPGTTNCHMYAIERVVTTPTGNGYMHVANNPLYMPGAQTSPAAIMQLRGGGPVATSVVSNQWYRIRTSFIGGNDILRVGSHEPTPVTFGNGADFLTWFYAGSTATGAPCALETLLLMHIEGPLATFLTAAADADAKARTFWTTAIEI